MRRGRTALSYRRRAGAGRRPKIGVFDVETEDLGGRALAVSVMVEGMDEALLFWEGDCVQAAFDFMLEHSDHVFYAHNAQYDWRYLLERLEAYREDLSFLLRGDQDVVQISLYLPDQDRELILRDSYAILPERLADLAALFCPEMPKLSIDIARFNPQDEAHRRYARRDAEVLLKVLVRFFETVKEHFEVWPGITAPSTSVRAWERTLPPDTKFYPLSRKADDFVRRGYYGGLVFLTSTRLHEGVETYDVNSAYPHVMETGVFPWGNPAWTRRLRLDLLSIYDVTVTAPGDLVIPVLPHRDPAGVLLWTGGTFRTTVTSVELEFALRHGYRIEQLHQGVAWTDVIRPFGAFVRRCRVLRHRHRGGALEATAKLLQNSLYGRFGLRPERTVIKTWWTEEEEERGQFFGRYLLLHERDEEILSQTAWAAFITAYARLRLLDVAYQIGPDRVIYGDTDSLTVPAGVFPQEMVGSSYGQFKLYRRWLKFRAFAPKVYAGLLDDGRLAGAVRGIPQDVWEDEAVLETLLVGKTDKVRYTSIPSFIRYLLGERRGRRVEMRTIAGVQTSRSFDVVDDGKVRPKKVQVA